MKTMTKDTLTQIAAAIGDGYTGTVSESTCWPGHYDYEINGPIPLSIRPDSKKIAASIQWPRRKNTTYCGGIVLPKEAVPYDERDSLPNDTIRMAATKTPEQIGREIRRRLIDPNTKVYAQCVQRGEELDAYDTGTSDLSEELAAMCGGKPYQHSKLQFSLARVTDEGWYGDGHITSTTSVDLHFRSVSPELARALIRTAQEFKTAKYEN